MNTTSNHRGSILRAILLCCVVALLGVSFVSESDAAPNGVKARTARQKEICEDLGGKLQVANGYKHNGPFKTLIQSTTTCKGGADDGYTCVNTSTSTECHQARTEATESAWADVDGPLAPITSDEPFASPQDFGSIEILASPEPEFGG